MMPATKKSVEFVFVPGMGVLIIDGQYEGARSRVARNLYVWLGGWGDRFYSNDEGETVLARHSQHLSGDANWVTDIMSRDQVASYEALTAFFHSKLLE